MVVALNGRNICSVTDPENIEGEGRETNVIYCNIGEICFICIYVCIAEFNGNLNPWRPH